MGAYIKENWLFVVVAVYLVSMVLYGHYRGFIRLAVSAVSLVLSLGVVHFGAPSVANLLRSNEVVYQAVEDSVTKFIQKNDEAENEAADAAPPSVQRSIIEEMDLHTPFCSHPGGLERKLLSLDDRISYLTKNCYGFLSFFCK